MTVADPGNRYRRTGRWRPSNIDKNIGWSWLREAVQCESIKSSWGLVAIFPKRFCGWKFFNQILHAYYAFLSTLCYEFLFNYLQLWRNYAILNVTTQFKSCAQNVHHRPKHTLAFSDIFHKQFGIFSPNFTHLLNVHIYSRLRILIQLPPTLTKLCHIKFDRPVCAFRSMVDILSI